MTKDLKSIKYLPIPEIIAFLIVSLIIFVAAYNYNFNTWIPVFLILIPYLFLLGGTNLISVTEKKIHITFLNGVSGKTTIELEKIIKVWSIETYELDDTNREGDFHLFKRNYNIEYLDKNSKKKLISFRINNRKKESEIINRIYKLSENKS